MDSTQDLQKLPKRQSKLIMDLVKGKECANQLQALLHKPFGDDKGMVLAQELAEEVLKSFTNSLADISSYGSTVVQQISTPDHVFSGSSREIDFHDSDESGKTPELNRRGRYKRRKGADSWVIVSATMEDGYAWRKYGQKQILDSNHPRCYYRCTHKFDQSCGAIKQVQKIDLHGSIMFRTTYFGHHTCKDETKASQIILDSDPMESNIFSFQAKIDYAHNSNSATSVKQESDQSDLTDSTPSIDPNVWQDLMVSPRMGSFHEEVVSSLCQSGSTTCSSDLDMMKTLSEFADFNNQDFPF